MSKLTYLSKKNHKKCPVKVSESSLEKKGYEVPKGFILDKSHYKY